MSSLSVFRDALSDTQQLQKKWREEEDRGREARHLAERLDAMAQFIKRHSITAPLSEDGLSLTLDGITITAQMRRWWNSDWYVALILQKGERTKSLEGPEKFLDPVEVGHLIQWMERL